jgi:hypothetical protein
MFLILVLNHKKRQVGIFSHPLIVAEYRKIMLKAVKSMRS